MTRTRIMLADDHTLFRQGIANLITAESDMEVVGEAANGNEAVLRAGEVRPDLVLMDIGMPGLSSFEATRQIREVSARDSHPVPDHVRRRGLSRRRHAGGRRRLRPEGQPGAAVDRRHPRRLPRRQLPEPRMLAHLVDDFRSRVKIEQRAAAVDDAHPPREGSSESARRRQLRQRGRLRPEPQRENRGSPQVQPDAQAGHPQQGAAGAVRHSEEDHPDPYPELDV